MADPRLVDWLRARGLAAAVITDPLSVAYLTGFACDPHERLLALVVTAGENPRNFLLVPGLELERAREAVTGQDLELVPWTDGEDPFARLATILGPVDSIAVEAEHLTLARAERLRAATGVDVLASIGDHLHELRARKSGAELSRLAEAARRTDQVYERLLDVVHGGITETAVARVIDDLTLQFGCRPAFETIALAGPRTALPHGRPGSAELAAGDLLLVDFGCVYENYCADITRVAVIGDPSARQLAMHGLVLEAHDRAIDAVREGVRAGDVDAAARRVIEQAGLSANFNHRVGHGLGLEGHEAPSLDPGSPRVLEAGMVITIEPGLYFSGWGGIRIEDDVVVERDGARLLTSSRRDLASLPIR